MKNFKLMMAFILAVFSTNALAYGSSSSKKACTKPKLTQFTPAHLSVVAIESEFSFMASASTNPESIEVSIKKQPIEITIRKMNSGYSVTGKLPSSLQSTHARINIKASGINRCKTNDGWLLKVEN